MRRIAPMAFDLDGVLLDVRPCIQKHLYDLYGPDGLILDNQKFRIETRGNHTKNKIWKAINSMYCDLDGVEPGTGAAAAVNFLYAKYAKPIRVVTARPERCRLETTMALDRYFPGVEFALVMAPGPDKHRHLENVDSFVEDRRRNAVEIAGRGTRVFLIDRIYNRMDPDPKNVIRVKDCYELLKYI